MQMYITDSTTEDKCERFCIADVLVDVTVQAQQTGATVQASGEWFPLPDSIVSVHTLQHPTSVTNMASKRPTAAVDDCSDAVIAVCIQKDKDAATKHSNGGVGDGIKHCGVLGGPSPGIYTSWIAAQEAVKGHR